MLSAAGIDLEEGTDAWDGTSFTRALAEGVSAETAVGVDVPSEPGVLEPDPPACPFSLSEGDLPKNHAKLFLPGFFFSLSFSFSFSLSFLLPFSLTSVSLPFSDNGSEDCLRGLVRRGICEFKRHR